MFLDAVKGCEWLKIQEVPGHSIHSYYTFAVLFEHPDVHWEDFYQRYVDMGGDGFYACWKNPYLEPSLKGKDLNGKVFPEGSCPISEDYQKKLMCFKTNYRDLELAQTKIDILSNLINQIGRN